MAGGVTVPAACCALPLLLPTLLLLSLLLPPAGRAAADTHCIRLVNVTTEHGHRRSDVRVNGTCACQRLSLFVRLNAGGMPVDCGQKGSWHDTNQTVSASAGLAAFRTVVAGCFQARCTCVDGGHCHQRWHFDGLDYYEYNLVISAVQLPVLPLRLDVHAWPHKNATQFYFPQLKVRLYRHPREERAVTDVVVLTDVTARVRVELAGAREPLTPGPYILEVLPFGSWVCQGSNNGCKRIEMPLTLSDAPGASGAVLPAAGDDRMKALYAVIGVTLAVIAAGLVFLWRECSAVKPGQGAPFVAKAPAPSGAQVLLVHLWTGERLAQLKAELRDAGLQVTDCQERRMASLLRTMPVADVLTIDRLQHAKIVFLYSERALQLERCPTATGSGNRPGGGDSCENGGGDGGGGGGGDDGGDGDGDGGGFSSAAGSLLGHEALFSVVLHCVRNSALAQDYQRVFVVLPEGGGGDDAGPAALVPGCRFRWPADGTELIRQLNLAPAETDRERAV